MEKNKKITIEDVAKAAGVSKGTVDRVIHERGEVSKKSTEKVKQAIAALDYEPNIYASMLASKKARTIACILPESAPGEFWDIVKIGFEKGGENVSALNIDTVLFTYDQYSTESFRNACKKMLESKPSAVILPPLFKNDTYALVNTLANNSIPYVFVDSKLEDDKYFAYFGMPMYQSGYLCAHLMSLRQRPEDLKEALVIRITRDKLRQSDPTINRRAGFLDYMAENHPDCEIHNLFINPNDEQETNKILSDFFRKHPHIRNIVMFNSRVHLICDYLKKNPVKNRTVIGFDNLAKNIQALKDGVINGLICQHTEMQSYNAVTTLADYLIMKKRPERKDNYMHMDILTMLNADNY